ncbi:ankyrin repeat-containing protein ITN1-like [Corylus avellana]|uniref:ankyrin repeat-containing protein ITN1-like n=1 Tax=Corylus avellana TaxID=13451 RepID=UPI00286BCA73|nr:ankyrin repeat-containing protein ITN1-like [Corylus avellana]
MASSSGQDNYQEVDEPVPDHHNITIDQPYVERQQRFQYLDTSVRLYQAALKGDWQVAKNLAEKCPHLLRRPITEGNETALHIAVTAKRADFVKELVKWMTPDEIALQNNAGSTALYFAAVSGMVLIAMEMVEVNPQLPLIRGSSGKTPLYVAALNGRREMVWYLYSVTPFEDLEPIERIDILVATISTDLYGFKGMCNKALMQTLAHELLELIWREVLILPKDQFSNVIDVHSASLFGAAKVGNVEYIITVLRSYPDLIWQVDRKRRSIFHIAVKYRHESVFNLIYEIGAIKDIIAQYIDDNERNMLHLAGRLAPLHRLNIISGAPLQMQRELLWFKEIEKIVPRSYKKKNNIDQEGRKVAKTTPWELFTKEHEKLKEQGEKWMKDTANYCMLVATLIATVVFAAAFTVPGGNNQEIGTPIFLKSKWFTVFFISDALALVSSSTSILVFLSILTSRYTEKDFLVSLPTRLLFGLATLFISIASMVVAFSATCFLVHNSEMAWLPITIIALTGVPVTLFVVLHFRLWADIIRSTYWSQYLFQPHKRKLF